MGQRGTHPARKAFDGVERTVGKPLEQAINTPSGGNVLLTMAKVSRMGFQMVRGIRTTIVHLAALPTNRDVDALAGQIGRLQTRVEELTQRLEETDRTDGPSSPHS